MLICEDNFEKHRFTVGLTRPITYCGESHIVPEIRTIANPCKVFTLCGVLF